MDQILPKQAQVIIIGGGIVGCSVAYHLARAGWTDTVLLERKQLTSGTTWHAAGGVGEFHGIPCISEMARYGIDLLQRLEAETGQATGFKRTGSIAVALNEGRHEELRRRMDTALGIGIHVNELSRDEIIGHWPHLNPDGILGGIHFPNDGQTNPIDTTMALAKGAKQSGVEIFENTKVTKVIVADDRVVGVETDRGGINADFVANCTGIWAHSFGLTHGVHIPIQHNQHFYVVTDPIPDLPDTLPFLRVYDEQAYYKEDAGKLLIGFSEPEALAWNPDGGIPDDFEFDELPCPEEHLLPVLEKVIDRLPALENVGIRKFFNGPEGYTPDVRFYLGEPLELAGYFIAAGFNSTGISNGPGAGKLLAEWIMKGYPPSDLGDVDIRRVQRNENNREFLVRRGPETLTKTYEMHWPYKQRETLRGLRRSPVHEQHKTYGAVFGELSGWERQMWYAPDGIEPEYTYGYGRTPWFKYWEAEHNALRNDLGLQDVSPLGKILVEGPDAEALLQRISTNDVAVGPGRVVYTLWLNERAGIETDLTIARLSDTRFLVMTMPGTVRTDLAWLRRNITESDRVNAVDITSSQAAFALMGPRAREFLSAYTDINLSNEAFPFGTTQEFEIGAVPVRAQRLSYVGELGWEIFVSTEFAGYLFEMLLSGDKAASPRLVGSHAGESLRTEKANRHWGHEMGYCDTPLEAGLMFACKLDKPNGFVGREALIQRREDGADHRVLQFLLGNPDAFIYHHEPVFCGGNVVGNITTGTYGHSLGSAVGLGVVKVPAEMSVEELISRPYEIAVAGRRIAAKASMQALYDSGNERVRC
jgi:heterotetrameric sarcosine oxidase gamma subunit